MHFHELTEITFINFTQTMLILFYIFVQYTLNRKIVKYVMQCYYDNTTVCNTIINVKQVLLQQLIKHKKKKKAENSHFLFTIIMCYYTSQEAKANPCEEAKEIL